MRLHSLFLLGQSVSGDLAENQMLLRCMHSPLQHREEERHQRGQRGESGDDLLEAAHQGRLWRRRTGHPAETRRTGELALFVGYAFTTECSSAMRTTRCRLT